MIFVLFSAILLGLVLAVLTANMVLSQHHTGDAGWNCGPDQTMYPPAGDIPVNCADCGLPNKATQT